MGTAAHWLWREVGEQPLSGRAAVAALLSGRYRLAADEQICAIVCGAGTDGIR